VTAPAPCATCRHEVLHIAEVDRVLNRFTRRAAHQPRIRRQLETYREARRAAKARHDAHLARDHGRQEAAA
jgi:hypothetical protein